MMTTLGELATRGALEFSDGYRTKRPELGGSGFRILRAGDVQDGSARFDGPDFVDANFGPTIGKKAVRAGDVVLTTKGTVGRTAFVCNVNEPAVYSPQLCYFRPDPAVLTPRFLYYWLSGPEFMTQANAMKASTDMAPYISLSQLATTKVTVPSLPEQLGIAEVLGALDDKIAANAGLVATIENLMIALNELVSRGSRLAAEARLVKEQVGVAELAKLDVDHYSLPAFDVSRLPARENGSTIQSSKFRVSRPCVLLSKLNPRFPRVWNVLQPGGSSVASTEFLILVPCELPTSALWAALASPGAAAFMQERAAGTSGSHQRVRPTDALEMPVPSVQDYPPGLLDQLIALGDLADATRRESRTLAELRDTLLPALMDGTVRVKDAISAAEEVL